MERYSGSGFSHRQGRTYYHPGKKNTSGNTICLSILLAIFLVGCPLILFYSEYNFALLVGSINEVAPDVVDVNHPSQVPWHGKKIVHTTGMINRDAEVIDEAFHVRVAPALTMERKTEYCQWMEHRSEECETCTEAGDADEGEVSYPCNCVVRYDYTKQWTKFRINSLLFDQPGAHHNPQRDPFPSQKFVSQNAEVNGFSLNPQVLNNLKAQTFKVDWNDFAQRQDQWYDSIWLPIKKYFGFQKTHFRYQYELEPVRSSRAALDHAFFYVGQGGYFFSPYTPSHQEMVLKWIAQSVEGSLLDWQLGDFFGCTPGDIRVSYVAKIPPMVSVIGHSKAESSSDVHQELGLINTQEGRKQLGLIHEGDVDTEDMFQREINDEKFSLRVVRVFFFIWAGVVADIILLYFGVIHSPLSMGSGTLGVWGIMLSLARAYSHYCVSFEMFSSMLYLMCSCGVLSAVLMVFPKNPEETGWKGLERRYKWVFKGEKEVKKGKKSE